MEKGTEKPWYKNYRLGPYLLKKTLTYPEVPLYTVLDNTAATYPTHVAIDYMDREISYRDLKLYVDKLATALLELGVKKGDRVATVVPNCPQFIVADWAILRAGATSVPVSTLRKASGLLHEIGESGAETVICVDDCLEAIDSIKDKTRLRNIIVTSRKEFTPEEEPAAKKIPGVYQFRDVIAEAKPQPPEIEIEPKEDLAHLCFTGGATGVPKGVMITHYNRTTNILQSIPWMYQPLEPGVRGKGFFVIPVPLFHAYGHWGQQVAIYWGLRILLLPDPRDSDAMVKIMKEYRPFFLCAVPTQLMRMAERKIGRLPVMIMSAAAPLPKRVYDAVSEEMKMPIGEGYGLTETGPITHMNLTAFSKITGFAPNVKMSIGLPVPDTEVKLMNEETGKESGVGEEGQIYLKGPQVMKGYWPKPGSGLVDGWLPSGDIGKMDEDGYFYLVDRAKDMASISGMKVYTTEVDEVLFQHPGVLMAVAVGIPDPERPGSERIKAFIRLKEAYEGKVTAEEIIELCRNKLPPYAVPKFVEFKDDLPVTVSEKLFKKALRDEEIDKMKKTGVLKY